MFRCFYYICYTLQYNSTPPHIFCQPIYHVSKMISFCSGERKTQTNQLCHAFPQIFISSPPGQNGNIWLTIFLNSFSWKMVNENGRISIQISLKFVPKSPIDNKPALVQVMVWRRIGDKPLSEPKLTQVTDAYMRYYGRNVNAIYNSILLQLVLKWIH